MNFGIFDRLSVKSRVTLATLPIFLISLWSISYYASQMLRQDMEGLLGAQQRSTLSVMAANIGEEFIQRLGALESVASTLGELAMREPEAAQTRLDQLPFIQSLFNAGVLVFRMDGTVVAEIPRSMRRVGVNYIDIDAVAAALKEGRTSVGRPVARKMSQGPSFGMTVPIRNSRGEVVGALAGVTNLGDPNFLDKVSGNTYGKTGGYLLVAPVHRLVVIATDKSRSMERIPAPGVMPLVDKFLQGYEGSGVDVNSKGVEVLASAKRVPLVDWYVAVIIPTEEAFEPIRAMRERMTWATLLLTFLASIATWWVVKQQLAPLLHAVKTLSTMSEKSDFPEQLVVTRADEIGRLIDSFNRLLSKLSDRRMALRDNERKLSEILENVDAFIYLKDTQGRYQFANRPLREFLGDSEGNIIGRSDDQFFAQETAERLRRNDQMVLSEGKTLKIEETNLQRIGGGLSTNFSMKLPLRNEKGDIYALCGISTDISERKKVEKELRIAAIAFECQEGILVMDAEKYILRVNQAFTQITGYSQQDSEGLTAALLQSEKHTRKFYEEVWNAVDHRGAWGGEMWHRRKNGDDYLAWVTIRAVKDEMNSVTHYVGNLTDATSSHLLEKQRLEHEAMHRDVLVREVHHRIKNNLQGIIGILRQFAQGHPETAPTINQAIGQVKGISIVHGLQGRADTSSVRLCELISAISEEIQALWQTSIRVDIPTGWHRRVVAEREAVPMALVLNELILNAVKHGVGGIRVSLRKGKSSDQVQISIRNIGKLRPSNRKLGSHQSGIPLVNALMPRSGAKITWEQQDEQVVTLLELEAPTITLESEK